MYSIKQMADKLGVSKQRVYRCIKRNCIKETHKEVVNGNTVLMYDDTVFMKISECLKVEKSHFDDAHCDTGTETHDAHRDIHRDTGDAHHDALYETLLEQLGFMKQQLKVKDQQLEEETKKYNELMSAFKTEQESAKRLQEMFAQQQIRAAKLEEQLLLLEQKNQESMEPVDIVTDVKELEPEEVIPEVVQEVIPEVEQEQSHQRKKLWWEFWKK